MRLYLLSIRISQTDELLTALQKDMPVIVCTLLQPENVLIKSDNSKSIGFQTKLSDFGLAKLLRENYYIVNRSGSGTVTHLAPELFQVSARLRHAHISLLLQMS